MRRISAVSTILNAILAGFVFWTTSPVAAQLGGRLEDMKLLSAQVGWTRTQRQLFWTTDGGHNWADITPQVDARDTIASVFFLDSSAGWALLSRYDEPQPQFDLASTTNSGNTWAVRHVVIPDLHPKGTPLATHGELDFLDPLHGWMNLSVVSSTSAHAGLLLATQDGGKNWSEASHMSAGRLLFANAMDGWVISPQQSEIYETHDGARGWTELSLKPPAEVLPSVNPTYDLPVFKDDKRGFLPVTYSAPYVDPNASSALVFFVTDDGGHSWRFVRAIPKLAETSIGEVVPSTIADSSLITATVFGGSLTLTALPASGEAKGHITRNTAAVQDIAPISVVYGLSFVSDASGWLLGSQRSCTSAMTGCTQLLATTNGGSTWTNVTPPPATGPQAPAPSQPKKLARAVSHFRSSSGCTRQGGACACVRDSDAVIF